MKKRHLFFLLLLSINSFSQTLTGNELLEKTIKFHDPNNNWENFKGTFLVIMKTPHKSPRESKISINLPEEFFSVVAKTDTVVSKYTIHKEKCSIELNGNENPSDAQKKKFGLNSKRANLYKNYYTYLYGLPMKLKDKGTIIHQKVEKRSFKGKDYLVLKASYQKDVGKDTWFFYFNPKTYAMEVYQFFKNTKDSGEYILLSGLETINQIKIPKVRAWFYNKNDNYLGTDILSKIK